MFPWSISACQCYVVSARIRAAWVTWVVPFVFLLLVGMSLWSPWFPCPGVGGVMICLSVARGEGLFFLRLVGF